MCPLVAVAVLSLKGTIFFFLTDANEKELATPLSLDFSVMSNLCEYEYVSFDKNSHIFFNPKGSSDTAQHSKNNHICK